MKLSKQYCKELYDTLNYHATWFPNEILMLGDIGVIKDQQFEREASLKDWGISYETTTEIAPADYTYVSKGGVSISTKLAGKAPAIGSNFTKAEAGISVSFNTANAIIFQAEDCEIYSVDNREKLGKVIQALIADGKWRSDFVVITTIVRSKSASVFISNEAGARMELAVQAAVKAGNKDIATLKNSSNLKHESKVGIKIIAESNLTPLFKISGFKTGIFFKNDVLVTRGTEPNFNEGDDQNEQMLIFTELAPDDLQNAGG